MADYKQLCADLVNELHGYKVAHPNHDTDLIDRARAELAKPEPEGPTDEEVDSWADQQGFIRGHGDHPCGFWIDDGDVGALVRAALALWGRPALPIPVNDENLPGPKDRDAEGRCWWFCPQCPGEYPHWIFAKEAYCAPTHWLPAHALTSTPFS